MERFFYSCFPLPPILVGESPCCVTTFPATSAVCVLQTSRAAHDDPFALGVPGGFLPTCIRNSQQAACQVAFDRYSVITLTTSL
jgi:hypothetical protein